MKKKLCVSFIFILLISFFSTASAAELVAVIVKSKSAIRQTPSLKGKVMLTVNKGAKFTILSFDKNGWIRLVISRGRYGWIPKKDVTAIAVDSVIDRINVRYVVTPTAEPSQFINIVESKMQDEILNLEDSDTLDELKKEGFLILVRNSDKFKKMLTDPLLLLVRVSPNGDLRLWDEKHGNVFRKTTLADRLGYFFENREKSGVFHDGTTTVIKTVVVNLPPLIRADVFDKTMEILRQSGAAPIYLNVIHNGRV